MIEDRNADTNVQIKTLKKVRIKKQFALKGATGRLRAIFAKTGEYKKPEE